MREYDKVTNCALSFDPAQLADFSALVVVDRLETWLKPDFYNDVLRNVKYRILKLERLPMGISYPDQIGHVLRTWKALEAAYQDRHVKPHLLIDTGGVGLSVYDTLREKARDQHLSAPIRGIRFTGGFYPSDHSGKPITNVPKWEIFSALTVAMQSGQIEINPSLKYAPVFREEAMNFTVEYTDHGHRTMEAAPGYHDDLLCAVAQAVWFMGGKKQTPRVLPRFIY